MTEDLDILVSLETKPSDLITLEPIRASLKPEHLVAMALRVGRPKDFSRIIQFLDEQAVDLAKLRAVLERHKLLSAWRKFCIKAGARDPLASK